jgi:hypothetical protein
VMGVHYKAPDYTSWKNFLYINLNHLLMACTKLTSFYNIMITNNNTPQATIFQFILIIIMVYNNKIKSKLIRSPVTSKWCQFRFRIEKMSPDMLRQHIYLKIIVDSQQICQSYLSNGRTVFNFSPQYSQR